MPRPRRDWSDHNTLRHVAAQSGGEGNADERGHADDAAVQSGDEQLGRLVIEYRFNPVDVEGGA